MREAAMGEAALAGIVVTEVGTRVGAGVCGSLLRQLGATVVLVEPATGPDARGLTLSRQLSAGKLSFAPTSGSAADRKLLERLLVRSDVILTSSDVDPQLSPAVRTDLETGGAVICDITAFGATGPLAGQGYSDLQVQAFSGVVDTTGMADG